MLQSTWSLPPQPLLEDSQTPLDYPVAALGDLLGPAVERMAEVMGVPRAMAAQSVLATSALVTQGHANVQLDGRVYPLSLYLLTIAASGDRKTAVDKLALQPAREWERLQWQVYREKLSRYRATLVQSQKPMATIDCHTDTPIQIAPEPIAPRLISGEPTIEALTKSLCLGLPSMGLFSDEGGQFLGSSTMSRDNRLKAVTTLSSLWDGAPIDRSRSMAGESLRAYDRRLSLHLMLQPYLAGQLLKDSLLNGQGFFARCLITWPQSLAGKRFYQPVDLTKDAKLKHYTQRITDLLQRSWAIDSDGALKPKALPLRSLARQTWISLHDTIEAQLGEFDELANVRPSASKAADNLLRIASVFAVLAGSEMIEVPHIQRASLLMDYYLTEIQRLTEQEPINTQRQEADRLLRWLQEKQWPPFTVRDLLRNGPRFARKSSDHTLALLVELITHQCLGTDGHHFEVRHVSTQ
ncbi:YfjI family protein [Pseudomonas protegens]|uniref:YfjI family protein n=1 Tax=Pseudomonas protegens TaxID=380021 RepID=UPI000F49B6A6|nr:YfjI family protein [Pseudomonas protegens]ROL90694.1 hypothetical protein BK639_18945 [Pseudomonas protegens]ROL96354.1 hypothetical protein BK640_26575 [Pseudomonas protegens]ROL98232.1 hypothetical protein BK641_28980 [Pseudomonas protegens]ROM08019.1 hypothetical protein BK642_15880 [Pseudomonas protegens]